MITMHTAAIHHDGVPSPLMSLLGHGSRRHAPLPALYFRV